MRENDGNTMSSVPDMEVIERQKENIAPLKRGRKASVLNSLYHNFESEQARQKYLTKERERFEAETESAHLDDLDDPLDVYHRYIRWIQESYPGGQNAESGLIHVLERCLSQFKHDLRYKNDPRHVRLWLLYASLMDDPLPIFQFLTRNDIGQDLAAFYEAYADYLERRGKCREADDTYQLGMSRKAQPYDRFSRKYKEFQRRLLLTVLAQDEEGAPGDAGLECSSEPFGLLSQTEPPGAPKASSDVPQVPLTVYSETGDQLPGHDSSIGNSNWSEIGTFQHRRKENYRQPEVWTLSSALPSKSDLSSYKRASVAPLTVYKDPDSASSNGDKVSLATSGGFGRLLQVPAQRDSHEKLCVDLSLVYANDGDEFSFEEIHCRVIKAKKMANVLREKPAKAESVKLAPPIFSPISQQAATKCPDNSLNLDGDTAESANPFLALAADETLRKAEKSENLTQREPAGSGKADLGVLCSRQFIDRRKSSCGYSPSVAAERCNPPESRESLKASDSAPQTVRDAMAPKVSPTLNTKAALADVYNWFNQTLPAELMSQAQTGSPVGEEDDTLPVLNLASTLARDSGSANFEDTQTPFGVFADPTVTLQLAKSGGVVDHSASKLSELSIGKPAYPKAYEEDEGTASRPNPVNLLDEEHLEWLLKQSRADKGSTASSFFKHVGLIDYNANKSDALLQLFKRRATALPTTPSNQSAVSRFAYSEDGVQQLEAISLLGVGGYAQVYLVKNAEGDCFALKVQKSLVPWESYILFTLHERLPKPTLDHVIGYQRCVQYKDESHLMLEHLATRVTLLDAVNWYGDKKEVSGKLGGFPEHLALSLASKFASVIACVHRLGILHGDIKPDNIMLIPVTGDRVSFKLIDWGRAMDFSLISNESSVCTNLREQDESTECWEMRYGAPFTFEPDWYGFAGVMHVMLFGQYLKVDQHSHWDDENNFGTEHVVAPRKGFSELLGQSAIVQVWKHFPIWQRKRGRLSSVSSSHLAGLISKSNAGGLSLEKKMPRAKLQNPFKRYWQGSLWTPLFDFSLNSGVYSRAISQFCKNASVHHPFSVLDPSKNSWTIKGSEMKFSLATNDKFSVTRAIETVAGAIDHYLSTSTNLKQLVYDEKKLAQFLDTRIQYHARQNGA